MPSTVESKTRGQNSELGPFAEQIRYLSIHHTEVRARGGTKQMDAVNSFHRDRFADQSYTGMWGGYDSFIDVDGEVTRFRIYGEKTAAQLAHNFDTFSVCLAGDFNIDMPRPAQIRALIGIIYDHPKLIVVFHRDMADRTCPGMKLNKPWLLRVLKEYAPNDAPVIHVHMGIPDLRADDDVLIAMEHQQDREKYVELEGNQSDIATYQRAKLAAIVSHLDRRNRIGKFRHKQRAPPKRKLPRSRKQKRVSR